MRRSKAASFALNVPIAAAIVAAAVVTLAPASPAFAQPRAAAAAADAAFREGRAAASRGDWATACDKFQESQKLDPAPGTIANIATCEDHLGHLTSALKHAREALAQLPRGDSRIAVVKKLASDLEHRVADLTIRLASNAPADAKVTLDGAPVEANRIGVPIAVDPGTHAIAISAAGRSERRIDVALGEGVSKEIVLEAPPADESAALTAPPVAAGASSGAQGPSSADGAPAASAPPDGPPSTSSGNGVRTAGFIIGGLGLASLVVGGVTGGMVVSAKQTVDQHCDAKKVCDQEGLDAGSSGKTFATISTVTVAAGAAALAGGLILVLVGHDKKPSTSVGVAALPGGSALVVGGRL